MSNSVQPHRRKPTRLPHPWDSPGKNTGVGCHFLLQCMKVKSESEIAQSSPTLSDPMDYSLPGSSIHGIFQARVLEWVAISFSNAWKWKVKVRLLSCVRFLVTPWTTAYQAPPSTGFSRQEYWSGVPLPSLTEALGEVKFPVITVGHKSWTQVRTSRPRSIHNCGPSQPLEIMVCYFTKPLPSWWVFMGFLD